MRFVLSSFAGAGVAHLYTCVLALFATLDLFNAYTVPLYSWLVILILPLAPLVMMSMSWAAYHMRYPKSAEEFKNLFPADAKKLINGNVVELYNEMRRTGTLSTALRTYYSALATCYFLLVVQIVFLYRYTQSTEGYQAAIDHGFPTQEAFPFAVEKKSQLLQFLQFTWVLSMVLWTQYMGTASTLPGTKLTQS